MLLWMITAGAGLYLLVAGRPARPAGPPVADGAATTDPAEAEAMTPVTVPASRPAQAGIPQAAAEALAAGARVPPIAHTRIATQPGQHPLLEFMHPALGIVGLGIWIAYVATKFGTFAWVSFGVLLATIAAGLTWYTVNRRQVAARSSEVLETAGAPGTAGVLVTRDVGASEAGTLGRGDAGDDGDAGDAGATLPAAAHPDPRVSRWHHPRAGDHHPPGLRPHLTQRVTLKITCAKTVAMAQCVSLLILVWRWPTAGRSALLHISPGHLRTPAHSQDRSWGSISRTWHADW